MESIKRINHQIIEIDGEIYRKQQNDSTCFYSPYETNNEALSHFVDNSQYARFKTLEYAEKIAFQQIVRRKFDNFIKLNGWNAQQNGQKLFLSGNKSNRRLVWGCRTHYAGGFEWTSNIKPSHGFDEIIEYMGDELKKFFELEEAK